MTQNIKFKIKQFQWFQMETKVRQIIQQVLSPIQKRILQSSAIINKLKTNQAQDQQRIQQISLMIANDPKVFQTGVFASVDKKFMQHSKLIQQLSRQVQQENKYVQNKFKILDLRMEQSSQVLKNIASLKQRVTKQMQLQNDNINQLRKNIQGMINDLNQDIRQTRKQISDNSQASQKRDLLIQEEIRRIKQNILTIQDNLALQRQMHKQKTTQLEQHQRIVQKHRQEIKELFDNKFLTKRLGDYVEDMDNQIKRIIFKVDSIAPLITQAQISQCLNAILPPKIRNKINIYEYKKYYQLNRLVLQKDYKNVDRTFNGLGLLQTMQKKCTKQIIQLKRKKLLQMGIDVDHATYQQRQRYYSEVNLQDQLNIDIEQTKVDNKIDESEIKKIIDSFFSLYMEGFKQQIKIQIQDNKKYIYSLQQQIRHQVGKFYTNIDSLKNQCSAFHTQHALQIKLTNNYSKSLDQQIKILQSKLSQTHDLQRLFYNFCSLINHLSIQDQIDKQNISLLGTRESNSDDLNQKQRNSIIALDGKCFSCNGFPATTVSAFKMACLAYHPSAIRIDSKEYKRQQLLQFTTNMLQIIKKHIQSNNNSMPKNIEQNNNYPPEFDTFNSRQIDPGLRMKSQTIHAFQSNQKGSFKNTFISKHLDTEGCRNDDERGQSGSKYRKKTLNTTYSSSYTKKKHSLKKPVMNEDMLKTSIIFNSLKKKNQSFLN